MDIHPFGEHDKPDAHPYEMRKTIPFIPGVVIEGGLTWEPEQETLFRGMNMGMKSSKNTLKGCIESYLKKQAKPQKHSMLTIWKSEMENCTTETRAHP